MPYFGQDLFKAQAKGSLFRKKCLDALEKSRRLMRAEGIDALMDKFKSPHFLPTTDLNG